MRCIWCNGDAGELLPAEVPEWLGPRPCHVHAEHAGKLARYAEKAKRRAVRVLVVLVILMLVGIPLLAVVGLTGPAGTLAVLGVLFAVAGGLLLGNPFATTALVERVGIRNALWLARALGLALLVVGMLVLLAS
jgi:hypothetical protein